jgi:Transmembrane secretion effector
MIRPWVLVVAAFTWNAVNTVGSPAHESFACELVGADRLPNAVALNTLIDYVASILGSAAAGLIIVHWTVTVGWAASALSSGALLIALIAIDGAALHRLPSVPRAPRQLRGAARAVWLDPALWIPLCGASLIATLSLNLGTLTPLLASETDGNAGTYVALTMGIAIGSAAGALAAAGRPQVVPAVFLTAAGFLGALEAIAAAGSSLAWQLTTLAAMGTLTAVFVAAVKSHLHLSAPAGMRGRIVALYGIGRAGSSLTGALLTGWLADRWSARTVLLAGGLAAILVAIAVHLAFALAHPVPRPARDDEAEQSAPLPTARLTEVAGSVPSTHVVSNRSVSAAKRGSAGGPPNPEIWMT